MTSKRYFADYPQLPRQKLAMSQKNDRWRESCVDAVDGLATSITWDGRSSTARKQINYDLMNSIIDTDDYNYVLDPFNLGDQYGGTPARLRHMNVVSQKIRKLVGDEIERPFDFTVMSVSGQGVSDKDQKKKETLLETAAFIMKQEAGIQDEEEPQFPTLEEAAKANVKYSDIRERYASAIIKNGFEDQRFEAKFSEGFEHGLIVGEEIYYTGIVANEPVLRVVNPLFFEWEKGPETQNIQDAGWAREERYMSVSEILDEFSEFLTPAQVRMLDDGVNIYSTNRNTMLPGYAYTQQSIREYDQFGATDGRNQANTIRVMTACWKSMKKIGFLVYLDENGKPQETIVDEAYELSEEEREQGVAIEWQWINEVWKGTKIGNDIYIDINPTANQMRTMDNPSECKLPYVGRTYNNLNSKTTSLLDMMKPHQYLYNVLWYRLENEIAKAKGKKFVFDLAQLPTGHGMDLKKWMYYFDNTGIAFINSFEEGKAGTRMAGQNPQFNQFTDIDLTLSNVVQQYIMIMNKIEQLIDTIAGIPKQAEGEINQYETATGIQQAVQASSTITQYYFLRHDEIKRDVLRQYIEVSKYAYAGGKKLHYITDDLERISMEIDGDTFIDSDYNVFPTNANKDKLIKNEVKQLARFAMQNDKANLSDMIALIKTNSMSEFETRLLSSEEAKMQRDQEAQQAQERIAQQQIQAAKEADERNHEQKLEEINLKGEWDLRKAVAVAQGFDEDKDRNNNNIPDVMEVGEAQIEAMKSTNAKAIQKQNQSFEAIEKEKDRQLKREEIKSKEKIEEEKNKVALKNKVVGEK